MNKILKSALLTPSVGYSQPWKFVVIKDNRIKKEIYNNFEEEYNKSKQYFNKKYKKLKLEGILEAPINIAIFYKKSNKKILGNTTQNNMLEYSAVLSVQNIWLMARSLNIGVGWVSILKPKKIKKILKIKKKYKLVAYLCLGYVKEFLDEPELKKIKWKKKKKSKKLIQIV